MGSPYIRIERNKVIFAPAVVAVTEEENIGCGRMQTKIHFGNGVTITTTKDVSVVFTLLEEAWLEHGADKDDDEEEWQKQD